MSKPKAYYSLKSKVLIMIAAAIGGCAVAEQWTEGWANHALSGTIGVLLVAGLLALFFMDDD